MSILQDWQAAIVELDHAYSHLPSIEYHCLLANISFEAIARALLPVAIAAERIHNDLQQYGETQVASDVLLNRAFMELYGIGEDETE